jgi:purine-nucleoside phosphorylase
MLELLHHAASLYHSFSHLRHTMGDAHDEMAASSYLRAQETVEFLRLKLPEPLARPRVAIVCGSGLGGLSKLVNRGDGHVHEEWEYKDVPNFPLSSGEYYYDPTIQFTPSCHRGSQTDTY